MDVVVDVLASNSRVSGRSVLHITDSASVLKLCLFSSELVFDVRIVAVLDVAVLNAGHLVGVLFWEHFAVGDGLNGGVVVVLVHFAVNDCLSVLVLSAGDALVLHSGVHGLQGGQCQARKGIDVIFTS